MKSYGVTGLVCAAACLPFDHQQFRALSVIDRGGDWGERYDRVIAEVAASGDLIEGALDPNNGQTWYIGNLDILKEAQALADESNTYLAALVVWNGESRGADDVSGHLKATAEARGLGVAEVLTL